MPEFLAANRHRLRRVLCVVGLLAIPAARGGTAEYLATNDFQDAETAVARLAQQYGPQHVLLVVDIDNTLLAMNDELGSDQWFEWQDYLLRREAESPHLVAPTFSGLLDAQGLLFEIGGMHPPQEELPAIIRRIQAMRVATLVLTSRGDAFRGATERELGRNGYDFTASQLTLRQVPSGTFMPYDPAAPQRAGLEQVELARFELSEARPVSYAKGVMMTAGQHKGAMLLTMLHRAEPDIRAVVFVDDHARHVGRVLVALMGREVDVSAIHYTHEQPRVAAFQYSDKSDVSRRWQSVMNAVTDVLRDPQPVP